MKKWGKTESQSGMFSFDGNFYSWTGKIFDLMLLSIYWMLGSLPVITIGASCSALYAAVTKSVRQERDSVTQQFWHSYKQNLISSVPLTLIYGMVIFLMLLNMGILHQKANHLLGLFFIIFYGMVLMFFVVSAAYLFPALSRFEMPAGWLIKVSFYMTVKHLPISLMILVLDIGAYFLLLMQPAFFLIVPGMTALLYSWLMEPLLKQHMPKK